MLHIEWNGNVSSRRVGEVKRNPQQRFESKGGFRCATPTLPTWVWLFSMRRTTASVLHVDELERKVVVLLPEQPHDLLKIIDLLAGDPDLVILNGWLDLHLETLNELDDFLAGIFGDTLLDLDVHVCYDMRGEFDLLDAQTFGVHFKPDALRYEHTRDRLDLQFVCGNDVNALLISVESDFSLHVFEIESTDDFTLHVVDRIVQCLQVHL